MKVSAGVLVRLVGRIITGYLIELTHRRYMHLATATFRLFAASSLIMINYLEQERGTVNTYIFDVHCPKVAKGI